MRFFLISQASMLPIRKKIRCTPEPKPRKLYRLRRAIGRCLSFPNRLDAAILAQGTGIAPSNLDSESAWMQVEEAGELGTNFEVVATCSLWFRRRTILRMALRRDSPGNVSSWCVKGLHWATCRV